MTDQTWTRTESGGLSDGRGWEIHRDTAETLKDDGHEGLPWSLWHHGEYVENYATMADAQAGAVPVDCTKCGDPTPAHRDPGETRPTTPKRSPIGT